MYVLKQPARKGYAARGHLGKEGSFTRKPVKTAVIFEH
jgi:hypothetical protein